MEAIYKLKSTELNNAFIEAIKGLFKGKDVVIKISEDIDETDFLTQYPANEKHILNNIAAEPTMKFNDKEFQDLIKD